MNLKAFKLFDKAVLAAAMFSVATLASCSKDNMEMANKQEAHESFTKEETIPGQYMVVLKDNGRQALSTDKTAAFDKLLADNNVANVQISANSTFANGFVANLSPDQLEALKKDERVDYIEEDRIFAIGKKSKTSSTTIAPTSTTTTTTTTSTSTTTVAQPAQVTPWGVNRVGSVSGVGKTAWIIDSGIELDHPDLTVDKTRSRSFLDYRFQGNYTSPTDEYGHGTEVAGIIGAKDNTIGVKGVAAGATLVSLRVMDKYGSGAVSCAVKALDYVTSYGKAGDVVNLSFEAGASSTLDDAVKRVAAKGIYVVCGAGNSSVDCSNYSPARVNATNVYTTSAMDESSLFLSFSNYGSPVDYAAPGKLIYSTYIGKTYTTHSGTSYAAPHLAGILLTNGGKVYGSGYVTGDKDSRPDPIAHR